ncbi:hypothetical protein [Ilumatobacter coccineus]|uniref:Uncharacterized protein n=1 Tax=Ilumatobacter coccineus (strain NBRC 103263 / KCTC 29153 / YM16-304) TaxID=1313172 RepID=A0A6C7E8N6_ILUCY|nr:hypothetical protein [Ilumatobacter coccineus]BAN03077.1 hypothetical protein YM304_27630 [Ilumatobacter coccineus YM16-304]
MHPPDPNLVISVPDGNNQVARKRGGVRRLVSGDWRVSAVMLAIVALFFCVPITRLLRLEFPLAPWVVAFAIIGLGTWWLVPERHRGQQPRR